MTTAWQLRGGAAARWQPQDIGPQYLACFNWGEGRRLPDESRAVHLVCEQALRRAGLGQRRALGERVGVVLAGGFGGLASYERFRAGLGRRGDLQPLAFSFSLPSIPASVLSLYYGITGPVLSLASELEGGGLCALETAMALLQSDLCELVITGSCYFPSATARQCGGPECAMAALAVLAPDRGDPDAVLLVPPAPATAALDGVGAPADVGDPWFDLVSSHPLPGGRYRLDSGPNGVTAWRRDQWP